MRILKDKLFIRVTKENAESVYSKEVTRNDGTKTRLYINVPALDNKDGRQSALTVQTAIVEGVGEDVDWIKKGDTALINYDVYNDVKRFLYKQGDDRIYFIEANTTYHKDTLVAYQNRKSRRDQIVHIEGELNELSPLLGIIRGDELIANDPYVFVENISNKSMKVSGAGIIYTETQKIFDRQVLSVSKATTERYGVKKGDLVKLDDFDIFDVKLGADNTISAVNDCDILAVLK
jgi:hypothetical protein